MSMNLQERMDTKGKEEILEPNRYSRTDKYIRNLNIPGWHSWQGGQSMAWDVVTC